MSRLKGARYSHAPFEDQASPTHRGEILYDHARELLKHDFDEPTITNIHAYILLSTYKITFGGSRLAYVYLGRPLHLSRSLEVS
jgi:hypothetical protein